MGRIRTTIELAKRSWAVLQADRELLALPVMSAIATMIAAATFLGPLFATGAAFQGDGGSEGISTVGYVVMAVMYITLAFITIFFNAALVHGANERLSGGDPTLGSALRGAAGHLGSIFVWAVISATVSVVLRTLEERAGAIGRIASAIAGVAWSVATFLVIPVLVIEGGSAVDAVKRSGSMLRQTWGEQVAGNVGFGLLGFLAAIPGVALIVLAVLIGEGALIGVAIALAVVWFIAVAVVLSAMNGIFQAALYRHAAGHVAGGPGMAGPATTQWFDTGTMQQAFRRR